MPIFRFPEISRKWQKSQYWHWESKITSEDGFFWQKAPCMTSLNTHYIEIYFLGTFLHHFRAIFGCMTDFRSNESDQRSQTVVIAAWDHLQGHSLAKKPLYMACKCAATPLAIWLITDWYLRFPKKVLHIIEPHGAAKLQTVKVWTIKFLTIYYIQTEFFQTSSFDSL